MQVFRYQRSLSTALIYSFLLCRNEFTRLLQQLFQFVDSVFERLSFRFNAFLADFHGHLILAACARFPRVGLIAETCTAGSAKYFKFNIKRWHNKWMLATAGSCLFGLFGVQRPPRQILVVRLSIHLNVTRSDASGMGGIGQSRSNAL
jgi:hypothetical protein